MTDLVRKRSITIAGHRTSFSLEDAFWQELQHIAEREGHSIAEMVALIDEGREGNLSSALRLYVLGDLQRRLNTVTQVQHAVSPAKEGEAD
ncbi:ribbon-helix-helix domain-containing protein [Thalassospira sp. TSL5-1]|uniref:ribbon-helix-helix domain-containing protein n=1 Tax=Thalassospira sp. TSL5-1 TaxID=1544451 RepID=UPI00093A0D64|nr:ribbon-helix-helix domain-containing protein [Thalassospira sp. TSL5-1]